MTPLTSKEAELFGDGVDLVASTEEIDHVLGDDSMHDHQLRAEHADFVVQGTIETLASDVDLEQRTNYRLVMRVRERLLGKPGKKELTLVSNQASPAFGTIERSRDHLLGEEFVAFVKRAPGPDGIPVDHFYLVRPSEALRQRIARLDAEQNPSTVVIVHEQKN